MENRTGLAWDPVDDEEKQLDRAGTSVSLKQDWAASDRKYRKLGHRQQPTLDHWDTDVLVEGTHMPSDRLAYELGPKFSEKGYQLELTCFCIFSCSITVTDLGMF